MRAWFANLIIPRRKSNGRLIASSSLILDEFDETLWTAIIESVKVTIDDRLIFKSKDGTEIEN